MEEFDEAILQMRAKGASGTDDIHPTFLKAPGPRARQELLDIFNHSFSTGKSPQIWTIAIILPLKKAEKTPGCKSLYRPVSLTSCVTKTLERILHNTLYYLAETRDWLCTEQARFRKNRSCEDQILCLTQSTSDGYQAIKPKKTVLTLLDYSKVFDRVWREDLLIRAIDKGLPITYAQWLRDVLSNRKAKVQINGERGRQLPLRQGLPQWCVLRPLLFLLYILLSYPKTWRWPCLPTMSHSSAATPIKKSLTQPYRKP